MRLVLLLLVFAFTGCATAPSPAVVGVFQKLLMDGVITQMQFDIIMDALQGTGFDWLRIVEIIGAIAGSLLGVRLWRGGINSRRGKVPPV